MRPVTIHEPLAARIIVVQGGRPRGGKLIASRQVEGAALEVAVSLDPLEEHGPRDLLRLPASEVWVDEEAHARWADSETRARIASGLLKRRTKERDEALADLAESRRAFETAVDDQQIEDASTAEKIATLTRERDEADTSRRLAWERLDRLRADAARLRGALEESQRRGRVYLSDLVAEEDGEYSEEHSQRIDAALYLVRSLDPDHPCQHCKGAGWWWEDTPGGEYDRMLQECKHAAALAGEGEVESLIPVDVDLLGLRLRATHPSPDDVGEAGSYQIMRLRTRRGEPILIDCGAGREIKITVRPSAGGATPENARQA